MNDQCECIYSLYHEEVTLTAALFDVNRAAKDNSSAVDE